ncbi:MAG: UDP-N-acetylmuramoyl-tripeptide--D-alanyl-D-alanine ligase [Ilumatobacteraceae bacterium]
MRIRASQAAEVIGGTLVGADVEWDGASFDTRSLRPGQLFVPLVAERDGHDFMDAAVAAGAAVTLWSRPSDTVPALPAIVVPDTAAALMDLAAWAGTRLAARVVGITGSVGKTSTKDLVRAAVAAGARVAANERSFNNEQGLPVTILGAPDDTDVLVLEMGMRGFGEIRRLCDVARPDIGVVTAVAPSHTERVGGIDGVARAKAELVEALPDHGTAVLNADDQRVRAMAGLTAARVLTFGQSADADVRITDLTLDALARPRFTVHTPWGTAVVELPMSGAHMAGNAAAALAVAGVVGVGLDPAVAALAHAELSAMRMQVDRAAAGGLVINDAYNANPTSMAAALEALAAVDAERRIAVLGMMAELDDPAPAHRAIAARAAELGLRLVAVGTDRYGVEPVDAADVAAVIGPVGPGTAVLVKASRAIGLDRLAAALTRA